MNLTSGLNLSCLLLGLATVLVLLLYFWGGELLSRVHMFDVRGKKPSLFLILNLVTVMIFLTSQSPASSAEHEEIAEAAISEGSPTTDDDEYDDSDDQDDGCDAASVDCNDYDCNNSSNNGDDEHDEDEYYEEDIDSGELQMRADEFIAKIIRGWMEERLRDAILMRPP